MGLKNIYIKQTNSFSFCLQEMYVPASILISMSCFQIKTFRNKGFFRKLFVQTNCTNCIGKHFKFQSGLPKYIMELSVKHTTLIYFVQVSVVLDSDTIQIYEGCQQKINLIGHLKKKLLTMAMNFIANDYSQLKTEKFADIQKNFLTCQLKHLNYHYLKKKFTKK